MRARRTFLTLSAVVLVAAGALVGSASPAGAATGFDTISDPTIDQPVGMAAAPDGTLWFTNYNGDSIGNVDPATGTVTDHPDANIDGPTGITVAPDGVVWFSSTENGRLGKIDGGVVTTYDVDMEQISDVEVAADGDIWFIGFPADTLRIGRFEPDTEDVYKYSVPGGAVGYMTPDPTAGMWFIWFNGAFTDARLRHITPPAVVTDPPTITGFSVAPVNDPTDVTWGPDNRLWFTAEDDDVVGRMNPTTGAVTTFTHPQVQVPNEIIPGPGGDLWFTIRVGGRLGRIDPSTGAIVTYQDPTDRIEGPIGLAEGGDGNVWYTRAIDLIGHLDLPTCDGREVTVDLSLGSRPTGAADVIRGTNVGNTIFAGGGNDVICSLGGNDKAYGGDGKDRLFTGPGNDLADGGAAADRCDGGPGADTAAGCELRFNFP